MKLTNLPLLALIPFLTAATNAEWRKKPPQWEGVSERSFSELSGCIGSKWASSLSVMVQTIPIERGISLTDLTTGSFMVDLTDEADRRVIRLWTRNVFGPIKSGTKKHIDKLNSCTK